MRSKLFVEVISFSEDEKRVLVKNEVYSEPVWIDREKLNAQNQVVEFILSQETRKQHRQSLGESQPEQTSTPISEITKITTDSDSVLSDLLGETDPAEPSSSNPKTQSQVAADASEQIPREVQKAAEDWTSLLIKDGANDPSVSIPLDSLLGDTSETKTTYVTSDQITNRNTEFKEPDTFHQSMDPVVVFDAQEEPVAKDETSTSFATVEQPSAGNQTIADSQDFGSTPVNTIDLSSLASDIEEFKNLSKQTQQAIASIGRGLIDLEPHMEIADGTLCLIVNWKEPISKQAGVLAVKVPQSPTGQFVVPGWKLSLFIRQIKSQITRLNTPILIQTAGYNFFYD